MGSVTRLLPALPRKRADLLLGLAFIRVPAKRAEEMALDARGEKLFQGGRGLLLGLLHFPRAERGASFRVLKSEITLKKTVPYVSAFVGKPLQGEDELLKNN